MRFWSALVKSESRENKRDQGWYWVYRVGQDLQQICTLSWFLSIISQCALILFSSPTSSTVPFRRLSLQSHLHRTAQDKDHEHEVRILKIQTLWLILWTAMDNKIELETVFDSFALLIIPSIQTSRTSFLIPSHAIPSGGDSSLPSTLRHLSI